MNKASLAIVISIFLAAAAGTAWSASQPGPQVVVSIKPIHALVAGVMSGVGEPYLLVKGAGSPHGYVLRPSEARALSHADLIIWVGHSLESFLEKPLTTLGRNAQQLELTEVFASQLLPLRSGGSWEAAGHQEHDEHAGLNPHFWLDPRLAKQLVVEVATVLAKLDPVHQANYRANAEDLSLRLVRLHGQLQLKLAPIKAVPYVVFHDAFQYFEAAYGLNAVGSLAVNPERQPGAKRIRQMREKIKVLQVHALFSEPQFEPRLIVTLAEGSDVKIGVLDPLGVDLPVGVESYFLLMNRLADNLLLNLR